MGENEGFLDHPTITAAAFAARASGADAKDGRGLMPGASLITVDPPRWTAGPKGSPIDFYYWHWGSIALYQAEGPSGPSWRAWFAAVREALLKNQNREGCNAGSWEPVDRWSAGGGRIYATAINALTLETPFRLPVFTER